jgi:hypothetical protein
MNDGAYMLAAAAEVLAFLRSSSKQTEEDLAIGQYTSSKNASNDLHDGSFIKKLQEPGSDPSKMSFFMPDHNGPAGSAI